MSAQRAQRTPVPYVVERHADSLPRPRVEDVSSVVSDLLTGFTKELIESSCPYSNIAIVLGARSSTMFPNSSRFRTRELAAWTRRVTVVLEKTEALELLFDPYFAPLMPYMAIKLHGFRDPLKSLVRRIAQRIEPDPHGFDLLWLGRRGFVTPLHHDGELVHGRWHLVVQGEKQWDFMPPSSPVVPRFPPWDLNRRFSALYKSPLPEGWLTEEGGGAQFRVGAGQMVTWGRNWWHRVEAVADGLTIGISTQGQRPREILNPRGFLFLVENYLVGEVEGSLEGLYDQLPVTTLECLRRQVEHGWPPTRAPGPTASRTTSAG